MCRVLTSDYYYPALHQAPFLMAARGAMDLASAWALVSANPAAAAGLADRGTLDTGKRADIVLIEAGESPRVVAVLTQGRIAFDTGEAALRLTR